jgi:hypothetical protein
VRRHKLHSGLYGVGWRHAEAEKYLRDEEKAPVDRVTVALLISALSLVISTVALFR